MVNFGCAILLFLPSTLFLPMGAALEVKAPDRLTFEVGTKATLPCTFKVASPSSMDMKFLAVFWQFQKKEILKFDNKEYRKPTDPRFSFKEEDVKKGGIPLYIDNVTVMDRGTYTCEVIYSPLLQHKDTEISVYAHPTISTLEKLDKDDESKEVICVVTGFYPNNVTVTLISDGKVMSDSVLSPHQTNSDGTYSINRTMILKPEEKPKSLKCIVQHEYLLQPLEKDVRLYYEGESSTTVIIAVVAGIIVAAITALIVAICVHRMKKGLMVSDIQGPPTWIEGEKITLYCTTSYWNPSVEMKWAIQDQEGISTQISEDPSQDKEEQQPLMSSDYLVENKKKDKRGRKGLYDFSSSLSFVPTISKHLNSTMTCDVECAKNTEKKTFKCQAIYARPQFLEPAEFTICNPGKIQLGINLRKFYPENIDIAWSCDKEKSPDTTTPEYTMNPDKTYNTKSKREFPADLFKDPHFKVSVSWKHVSMNKQESRAFSAKDFPWHPQIEDIVIEKSSNSNEAKLSCKIQNFFPDLLSVTWFEKVDGRDVDLTNNEIYTISTTTKQGHNNHTFSGDTSLSFEKSLTSGENAEYICRVQHPSLQKPIESSSGLLPLTDLHSFIVQNIMGLQNWIAEEKVTLYCSASYCKKDVLVTWDVKEGDGTARVVPELPPEKTYMLPSTEYVAVRERTVLSDKEGLHDITSSLSFTPSISKHKNMTLSCKLTNDGKTKERSFQITNLYVKPKASKPIKLALLDSGEVLGTFHLEEFYPNDIQINWMGGAHATYEELTSKKLITDHDYTHTATSECRIQGHLFKNPDYTVKVFWKHNSMDAWESRQISIREKDYPWRPEIQNIPLPSLIHDQSAHLMCKISNFFPDNLTVKWLRKEAGSKDRFPVNPSEKYNVSEIKPEKQNDHTFMCTSSLNITPSLETDQGAEFICVVEHPSLENPVERSTGAVQVVEDHQKFTVNNIQGPQEWIDGEKVILYCTASYCTEDVSVSWNIEEKNGSVFNISESKPQQTEKKDYVAGRENTESMGKQGKQGLCNITSSLKLTPSVEKHLGAAIKCIVVCKEKTMEKQFKPQSICAKPVEAEPVKVTLCDSGVMYSLNLQNFYPKDLRISWTYGIGRSQKTVESTEKIQENSHCSYNALSDMTVPESCFKDSNFKVCVSWEHKSLECPESKEFSFKDSGFTWRPEIKEIPISNILLGKKVTLQNNVCNYYPGALSVKWLKKEKNSQEYVPVHSDKKYQIPDLQHDKQWDKTYSCTACLVFIPSLDSDEGAEFLCRVEHPSLEEPIETRTKPLQVMAKPEITDPLKLATCKTGEVLCQMNLKHFYPQEMDIRWVCGSNQIKSQENYKSNPDLTFNVVSECPLDKSAFSNPDNKIRAQWKHISMEKQEIREVSIRDPESFPWRPVISEISVPQLRLSEKAIVKCEIIKYYPDALTVKWVKKKQSSGQESQCLPPYYTAHEVPLQRQEDHSYSCQACLTFIPSIEMDEGVELLCMAEHPSLKNPISRVTGVLKVTASPKPQPIAVNVNDNGEVLLSLELRSFYPKDITIGWSAPSQNSQNVLTSEERFTSNADSTWTVQSQCKLPNISPVLVQCKQSDGIIDASWGVNDFPWHPKIDEIITPPIVIGQEVTLSCRILHCVPSALTTHWYMKESGSEKSIPISNEGIYKIPPITWERENQTSFSCTSKLVFTPSLETKNIQEFICKAEHAGYPPLDKRTGPLQMAQPAHNFTGNAPASHQNIPPQVTIPVFSHTEPAQNLMGNDTPAWQPAHNFTGNAPASHQNIPPQVTIPVFSHTGPAQNLTGNAPAWQPAHNFTGNAPATHQNIPPQVTIPVFSHTDQNIHPQVPNPINSQTDQQNIDIYSSPVVAMESESAGSRMRKAPASRNQPNSSTQKKRKLDDDDDSEEAESFIEENSSVASTCSSSVTSKRSRFHPPENTKQNINEMNNMMSSEEDHKMAYTEGQTIDNQEDMDTQ